MRDQELVNALRCVSTAVGPMGDCKKCPFYKTEPVPEDLAGKVNLTEWFSCDVDAVGLAAADRIANQSNHIAALQQEIEKLRGQNEQLREAAALVAKESAELLERRWIPVEERLPEDRSDVLVVAYWHERWGVYMGWCAPERAAWSVHIGIGDRSDIAVTHWMPLPEPPEVE